nr:hypothetical protein [Tanacetum cinerariifolium]
MPGSELGEMILKSSQAMVPAKFNMNVYVLEMTPKELEDAIREYGIPLDLHPQLPLPYLTMDKLPSEVHVSQLIPMGVHRVIMFEIRCRSLVVEGHSRKCFKEITSSLRGWKKKFFLIDRRAIPKAMPWRHANSDLRDDFPTNYQERDAARLSAVTVPLRPPLWHLLYMCGMTTLCQHPKLSYNIKMLRASVMSCARDFIFIRVDWGRVHPSGSTDGGDSEADGSEFKFVPDWGLWDDLQIFTYRACKEPIIHLATHAEGEFLRSMSNVDVVHRAYVSLGRYVLSQGELLKRHESLYHDYVDLCNRNEVDCGELDRARNELLNGVSIIKSVERTGNKKKIWRCTTSEQVEKAAGVAKEDMVHQCLVREFIPDVVRKLHISVKYRQSVAVPVSLCFTVGWLSGLSLGRTPDYIEGFNFPE